MPTNCAQLERPLLRYSAPVSFTIRSNSMRGISLSTWLNMLHDAFTLGLPSVGLMRLVSHRTLHAWLAQRLIPFWTRVGSDQHFRTQRLTAAGSMSQTLQLNYGPVPNLRPCACAPVRRGSVASRACRP